MINVNIKNRENEINVFSENVNESGRENRELSPEDVEEFDKQAKCIEEMNLD